MLFLIKCYRSVCLCIINIGRGVPYKVYECCQPPQNPPRFYKLFHRRALWQLSGNSRFEANPCPVNELLVIMRSFIKALMGVCRKSDLDRGPLHYLSAALTTIFIARAKRISEVVHPVIIPFSSRCQPDVSSEVDLSLSPHSSSGLGS